MKVGECCRELHVHMDIVLEGMFALCSAGSTTQGWQAFRPSVQLFAPKEDFSAMTFPVDIYEVSTG